jgi:hypothetical protein
MAIKTVNFKRPVTFTGRNGTFKCIGVELMECGDRVQISPITSKGQIGRCDIDVPAEDVDAFIEAFQSLKPKPKSYDETPHEAGCAKRQHGAAECDCVKADMDPDQ